MRNRSLARVDWLMIVQVSTASFITYLSMYAFRKPFTAATFDGVKYFGMDYKILLVIAQLIGYTLSKFLGVRFVSELGYKDRPRMLVLLMGTAWLSLLFFALVPAPYNIFFMFLNGLPLGMIWGVVFGYLEGRRVTELLGAVMASSFIVSSGLVKNVGRWLLDTGVSSERWMPFVTGLIFVPVLALGIILLVRTRPPGAEDVLARTVRVPMNRSERMEFIVRFGFGIFLSVLLYTALTVFRDIRDNFAVEIWFDLGFSDRPSLLVLSEVPIAVGVLLVIAAMIALKDNRIAFHATHIVSIVSGCMLLGATFLQMSGRMGPVSWMIIAGLCMYLPYMAYHTLYFERWIAHYRHKGNIGFLMSLADSFGYLGSTIVLLVRNFAAPEVGWLEIFRTGALLTGGMVSVLGLLSLIFFRQMDRRLPGAVVTSV
jgi:hypothetical protein